MRLNRTIVLFFAMFLATAAVRNLYAAPFNDDMVNIQIKAGQLARAAVTGTVPRGSLSNRIENKQQAEGLVNTRKDNPLSEKKGARLFRVNCFPCHGDISQTPYSPGPIAQPGKFMPPPDISGDYYTQKSDGYIYGTIHFGGVAMMPALGWKLSPDEHWDIINYVRSIQTTKKAANTK